MICSGGAGALAEEADRALHGVNLKIRKNKDGKPRKRSQHTKGNKLWEFIRDALKDANTCPSVVRLVVGLSLSLPDNFIGSFVSRGLVALPCYDLLYFFFVSPSALSTFKVYVPQ